MANHVIGDVSDTAFWVAHYRGIEGDRPMPLFRDPLAGVLAGERGKKIAKAMPYTFWTGWSVVIRTCIIDDYIRTAIGQGVEAVLNLGAGLDTRPYRLELPESFLWIEADYPAMIEYKEEKLAGEKPRCHLERVKVDLADTGERRRLFASVNARSKKILVLAEGVVPYLEPDDVASLADDLKAMDHASYWVVDYFSPQMVKYRRRLNRRMGNAPFKFMPKSWFEFFQQHGWRAKEIRYLMEEAEKLRRPVEIPWHMKLSFRLWRLFMSKQRREKMERVSGYVMLERESGAVQRGVFESAYATEGGHAPWDIGKVQPAFRAAADRVVGSVLDAGCGTGENALFFAARDNAVTGFDFLEAPILAAKRKASERGLKANFIVADALKLEEWTERFDNAIDSGLFHVFSDEDRARYVRGLSRVLKSGGRLFILCFSDQTPGTQGPRRITQEELRRTFADGWEIESIELARFETRPEAKKTMFAGEDPKAWFVMARRAS